MALSPPSEDPPMIPVHVDPPMIPVHVDPEVPPIPAFVEVFEQMQAGKLTRCALMSVPLCFCGVMI